jgi:hypothetical protein
LTPESPENKQAASRRAECPDGERDRGTCEDQAAGTEPVQVEVQTNALIAVAAGALRKSRPGLKRPL